MSTTSLTLLDRLRQASQPDDWDRFVRLYTPLLLRWATLQGFQDADAEDLAQSVLIKLIRVLPMYERRNGQTFRSWLFTVCRNECSDFRSVRATRPLPPADGLSTVAERPPVTEVTEAEYRRRLVQRALELVRTDFTPAVWGAFTRYVIEQRPAAEIARELNISVNSVYLARHRVLARVRQELAGLID